MTQDELKTLVATAFADCEIEVEGGDGRYALRLVGEVFAGLPEIKRQQKVYAVIKEHIQSGAIHAVSIRALSPDQADVR